MDSTSVLYAQRAPYIYFSVSGCPLKLAPVVETTHSIPQSYASYRSKVNIEMNSTLFIIQVYMYQLVQNLKILKTPGLEKKITVKDIYDN